MLARAQACRKAVARLNVRVMAMAALVWVAAALVEETGTGHWERRGAERMRAGLIDLPSAAVRMKVHETAMRE